MIIDPTIQAAIDDGTLTIDELAAAAWAAIEMQLRAGFQSRRRGADAAKIARMH